MTGPNESLLVMSFGPADFGKSTVLYSCLLGLMSVKLTIAKTTNEQLLGTAKNELLLNWTSQSFQEVCPFLVTNTYLPNRSKC